MRPVELLLRFFPHTVPERVNTHRRLTPHHPRASPICQRSGISGDRLLPDERRGYISHHLYCLCISTRTRASSLFRHACLTPCGQRLPPPYHHAHWTLGTERRLVDFTSNLPDLAMAARVAIWRPALPSFPDRFPPPPPPHPPTPHPHTRPGGLWRASLQTWRRSTSLPVTRFAAATLRTFLPSPPPITVH